MHLLCLGCDYSLVFFVCNQIFLTFLLLTFLLILIEHITDISRALEK